MDALEFESPELRRGAGPKSKDQVNTDSDSRIMPSQGGGFEQAYNGQAAVDIDSMLIVENRITQQSNDKLEVVPAVENLSCLPDNLGAVDTLLADAGYFSRLLDALPHS